RTLGVGVKSIVIRRPQGYRKPLGLRVRERWRRLRGVFSGAPQAAVDAGSELSLRGVVYTSVFNPEDGRKNWEDMVTAFCWAFRDQADATLVLKMSTQNVSTFLGTLKLLFSTLPPFKCRVVAVHGFLTDAQMQALARCSHYVVSTSLCEGQCLPLMEFMGQGVAAITPDHTAMRDYIRPDNAFVVASGSQPGFWPFDERKSLVTLRHRIDWMSLKTAFEDSHRLVREDRERYLQMCENSRRMMVEVAGLDVVREKLRAFLERAASGERVTAGPG
ncbi:MAG: glycosyltransferase, partial [Halioglobus sp.]|nr:glycosyltransferase [Halioglobus sp.]